MATVSTVVRREVRTGQRTHQGHEVPAYTVTFLSCGHVLGEVPLDVGAEIKCERCGWNAAARQKIADAHASGTLAHTRSSRWGHKTIDAYRRAPDSPTGVLHLCSIEETPENVTFLRSLAAYYSPLSPTEAM